MTIGMLLLILLAIAVFCGLLQRVLDRMHLNDRQALVIIGLMLLGTFIPNLEIGIVSVNIGGAVIPIAICVYLFIKADSSYERLRSLIGSMITGTAVFLLSVLLPSEAEQLPFDPLWLYGILAGLIAWLAGRSRRCAFVCGVMGVVIADLLSFAYARLQEYSVGIIMGGAGIADAVVVSGVIAVLFCELLGELIERFARVRISATRK